MGKEFAKVLSLVIHNDSMRTDPPEIYGLKVFTLVVTACMGGMTQGWDIGAIGGVVTYSQFMEDYGYTADTTSLLSQNIVSSFQAGCFFAALFIAPISERFGRKWAIINSSALGCVGVAMQAGASGSLGVMYGGRIVGGLGLGALTSVVPCYISECAPRAIRGGLVGSFQLFTVIGTMLSFWVNYGVLGPIQGPAVYIIPLALQALPNVILCIGMLFCPESPRWCATKDNWERATAILSDLSNLPLDHDYIQTEIQEISDQLNAEREAIGEATTWTLLKEMCIIPSNRKRTLLSMTIMMMQQMAGITAMNYYAPQIFKNIGLDGSKASLFATGIYGVVKTVTSFIFVMFMADSLGRRRSLLLSCTGCAISMFLVGIYIKLYPPVPGAALPPFGYVAMVCVYLFTSFYQWGLGPVSWILISEIATARLRATSVALSNATQWLFNFIMARTTLTMMDTMGHNGFGAFLLLGSFCAVFGVFDYFFVPETKGLSLEKMDELFGVSSTSLEVNKDVEKVSDK